LWVNTLNNKNCSELFKQAIKEIKENQDNTETIIRTLIRKLLSY